MIKKIKNLMLSLAFVAGILGVSLAVAQPVSAATLKNNACSGLSAIDSTQTCGSSSSGNVNKILKTVINLFSLIVGVAAVIMIMVAGFKFITSGGESSNITSAKNTIIYAIVGLVVVALAQIIVRFVLTQTK